MKKEIEELAMSIRGLLSSVYYMEEELKDILADAEYVSRRVEEEFKLWELVFWVGSFDLHPVTIKVSTDKSALRAYYESLDKAVNPDKRFPLVEDEEKHNEMLEDEFQHWSIETANHLWLAPLSDK
jgi:rubrerythrin